MLREGDARSLATSYRKLGGSICKTPFRASLSRGGVFFGAALGESFRTREQ